MAALSAGSYGLLLPDQTPPLCPDIKLLCLQLNTYAGLKLGFKKSLVCSERDLGGCGGGHRRPPTERITSEEHTMVSDCLMGTSFGG